MGRFEIFNSINDLCGVCVCVCVLEIMRVLYLSEVRHREQKKKKEKEYENHFEKIKTALPSNFFIAYWKNHFYNTYLHNGVVYITALPENYVANTLSQISWNNDTFHVLVLLEMTEIYHSPRYNLKLDENRIRLDVSKVCKFVHKMCRK